MDNQTLFVCALVMLIILVGLYIYKMQQGDTRSRQRHRQSQMPQRQQPINYEYYTVNPRGVDNDQYPPSMITSGDYHLEPGAIADAGSFTNDIRAYLNGE